MCMSEPSPAIQSHLWNPLRKWKSHQPKYLQQFFTGMSDGLLCCCQLKSSNKVENGKQLIKTSQNCCDLLGLKNQEVKWEVLCQNHSGQWKTLQSYRGRCCTPGRCGEQNFPGGAPGGTFFNSTPCRRACYKCLVEPSQPVHTGKRTTAQDKLWRHSW